MEGAHLKTAGACFIAKSSPKAPPGLSGADPGVQRGRLAQNGHRWHLLCARPWGWRLRALPALLAVTLWSSPFSR